MDLLKINAFLSNIISEKGVIYFKKKKKEAIDFILFHYEFCMMRRFSIFFINSNFIHELWMGEILIVFILEFCILVRFGQITLSFLNVPNLNMRGMYGHAFMSDSDEKGKDDNVSIEVLLLFLFFCFFDSLRHVHSKYLYVRIKFCQGVFYRKS